MHSPRPWIIRCIDKGSSWRRFCVVSSNGIVANVDEGKVADMESNAVLISAAPDLLEALREIVMFLENEGGGNLDLALAHSAIAKATKVEVEVPA